MNRSDLTNLKRWKIIVKKKSFGGYIGFSVAGKT
jgi:hypothetical protein